MNPMIFFSSISARVLKVFSTQTWPSPYYLQRFPRLSELAYQKNAITITWYIIGSCGIIYWFHLIVQNLRSFFPSLFISRAHYRKLNIAKMQFGFLLLPLYLKLWSFIQKMRYSEKRRHTRRSRRSFFFHINSASIQRLREVPIGILSEEKFWMT